MKQFLLILFVCFSSVCNIVMANGSDEESTKEHQWQTLKPEVQLLLKRFEADWSKLPDARKNKLVAGANRWNNMSPENKKVAGARFKKWQKLPDDQKKLLKKRFDRFKKLPPETQIKLRKTFAKFKNLTAEQRKILRDKFKNMSPEKRRQMIKRMQKRRNARKRH